MRVLKSRLYDAKREAEMKKRSEQRMSLIGSGDRNERIRTYNFPQNRLTDHRINLTLYKLDQIMAATCSRSPTRCSSMNGMLSAEIWTSNSIVGLFPIPYSDILLASSVEELRKGNRSNDSDSTMDGREALEWTTEYLARTDRIRRARRGSLLAHARHCQRIQLYTAFDQEPSEQERAAFREMVRRTRRGNSGSLSCRLQRVLLTPFVVSPDVLIPRPETEHVVIEALDCAKRRATPKPAVAGSIRVADLCTGSGCIAVALANICRARKLWLGM